MGQVWVDFEGQAFCSGGGAVEWPCLAERKLLPSHSAVAVLSFFCCSKAKATVKQKK